MDLQALRNSRKTDYSDVKSAMNKIANPNSNQNQKDERFWSLEGDEAGNGSAIIRFLPKTEEDELPWVRVFSYGFKGPTNRWYIENSPTTIGLTDPVAEINNKLWETGTKENQDIVRSRKRRLSYISNIMVVNDPKHPENNGKVFLFRYGKTIFDMIMDKANPDPAFADEVPVFVYDLWEGADFKMKMRKVDGYTNFDKSEFTDTNQLHGGDEQKLLETVNAQYPLKEFIDPSKFKSYDELKKRLDFVLGLATEEKPAQQAARTNTFDDPKSDIPTTPAKEEKTVATPKEEVKAPFETGDDDSDMDFFRKLANE